MRSIYLPFIAALALLVTGCGKDNLGGDGPAPLGSEDLFNYSDGDALLVTDQMSTIRDNPAPTPDEEVITGSAYAVFHNPAGGFLDAGNVLCQDSLLEKDAYNVYRYNKKNVINPTREGLAFGSNAIWDVSGNDSIPEINGVKLGTPSTSLLTNKSRVDTVFLSKDYKLEVTSASSADSLMVILASGDTYIEKRVSTSSLSVKFTAAELAALDPTTTGLIQVIQYRIKANTASIPGKKIYQVNSSTSNFYGVFAN